MHFNYQTFIQDLRDNPEKVEVVQKYETKVEPIFNSFLNQIWYKEYASFFKTCAYQIPEELLLDFEWEILMQLVASSFSSDGLIEINNDINQFIISVQSGDQVVVKTVDELKGFQILRLFEIYIEEQMNLQVLIAEDEKEKEAIYAQRDARSYRWNLVMKKLSRQIISMKSRVSIKNIVGDIFS